MHSHSANLISDHAAGWIFLGAGCLVLWLGLRQIWRGHRSRTWPQAAGTVVSSGVRMNADGKSNSYSPAVSYRYAVNGAEYRGEVIRSLMLTGNRAWAEARAARYPEESAVPVFYQPSQPSVAVLEHGADAVVGAMVLMIGTMFPYVGWSLLTGRMHS